MPCKMEVVRVARIFIMVLYASYLTNVGLLLTVVPWSEVWVSFLLLMPAKVAGFVDSPPVRGAISAFGVLHLLLLVAELVVPDSRLRKDM